MKSTTALFLTYLTLVLIACLAVPDANAASGARSGMDPDAGASFWFMALVCGAIWLWENRK